MGSGFEYNCHRNSAEPGKLLDLRSAAIVRLLPLLSSSVSNHKK